MLGKSHSSVSRQIDKLEKKGLIRTKDGPTDARVRSIELSTDGEKLKEILDKTRMNNISKVLDDWSDSEKADLLKNLQHLAATLNRFEETDSSK